MRHCEGCGRELMEWTETTSSGMKVNHAEDNWKGKCGDCQLDAMFAPDGPLKDMNPISIDLRRRNNGT